MTTEPVDYGCSWPIDPACFEDTWDDLDDDVKNRSIDFASATLRRLTGYRVGGCPITVRPCKASCREMAYPSYYDMLRMGAGVSFWPHISGDGLWVNSCGCRHDCSCGELCTVKLPPPVGRVDAVWVDGSVQFNNYRVDGDEIVWIDQANPCPFPACQDLTLDHHQPGTFAITYLNAYPVDNLGAYAAGVLAMEFAKACSGAKCRLPAGVTSVTRQGVSYQVAAGTFPGGVTGIREVDAYIGLWNPQALVSDSRVWTPDMHTPRVPGIQSMT